MRQAPRLLASTLAVASIACAAPARAEAEPSTWVAGVAVSLWSAFGYVSAAKALRTNETPYSRLGGGALVTAGGILGLAGAGLMGFAPRDEHWAATAAGGGSARAGAASARWRP